MLPLGEANHRCRCNAAVGAAWMKGRSTLQEEAHLFLHAGVRGVDSQRSDNRAHCARLPGLDLVVWLAA